MHTPAFGVAINKIHGINNEENGLKRENYFLFSSLFFWKRERMVMKFIKRKLRQVIDGKGIFHPFPISMKKHLFIGMMR